MAGPNPLYLDQKLDALPNLLPCWPNLKIFCFDSKLGTFLKRFEMSSSDEVSLRVRSALVTDVVQLVSIQFSVKRLNGQNAKNLWEISAPRHLA